MLNDERHVPSNGLRRCQGDEVRHSVFHDVTPDDAARREIPDRELPTVTALRKRRAVPVHQRMRGRKPAEHPVTVTNHSGQFDDCMTYIFHHLFICILLHL